MAEKNVKREVRGVIFLALAAFLFICLLSYDRLDPSLNVSSDRVRVENYAGPVGAYTADILILFFGLVAYLLPVGIAGRGILGLFCSGKWMPFTPRSSARFCCCCPSAGSLTFSAGLGCEFAAYRRHA